MASSLHEYTDSEDDVSLSPKAKRLSPTTSVHSHSHAREASSSKASHSPRATVSQGPSGPRVKLTFRPSLNHLVHSDPQSSLPSLPPSERSSLSPPPPITLKLGMASRSKANYSSDSSDADADDGSRPAKRPKTKKKAHPPEAGSSKKSYDWLQPSKAGASHSGPPDRGATKLTGWAPPDALPLGLMEEAQAGAPKKRSHKRAAAEGPGKAWRKGIKKGMTIPWKEGGAFVDPSTGTHTPGDITPRSDMSPEPQYLDPNREPSPPFVPADPEQLGFPVFSKPIVPPKINLGAFPKVTQLFLPNNGGDPGKFPRKEKVRSWTSTEKVIVGIGGGQMIFKSWLKGPATELSAMVEADIEASKEIKETTKLNKAKAAAAASETPDRPALISAMSSDSTPTIGVVDVPAAEDVDLASEIGDGDESVISIKESTPPARAKRPIKAKPRKSKLAQEIHPVSESTSAIEDLM